MHTASSTTTFSSVSHFPSVSLSEEQLTFPAYCCCVELPAVRNFHSSSHVRFTAPAIGFVGGPTETACNSWNHSLGIGFDVY
ncbi:hypothetical protein PRIPAC_82654 [Pristionchus pacificus]|uniref:Uncharacterized protein n=1 Tax=Pristionchus pacificus TaxID=54126 RepID=A0A2A6BHJ5_PRIPA|nr:hypothetical protein PRIPAC_82654 [Pristionchus pacificus]|eukprot:PDM65318.1 hypothetical protein PRIPAC_52260 [Pristionchus pacificus]